MGKSESGLVQIGDVLQVSGPLRPGLLLLLPVLLLPVLPLLFPAGLDGSGAVCAF